MICIKCGQELEEGSKFCIKCGFGVTNTDTGNKLLKITGILFIVFGAFGVISLIGNFVMRRMVIDLEVPTISGFTIILSVLNILLSLFLGITGVMYCKDIKKAKSLKYFAFVYIGFYVISSINTIVTTVASLKTINAIGPSTSILSMIFGIIIGFVIPILYLMGAQKNLKA